MFRPIEGVLVALAATLVVASAAAARPLTEAEAHPESDVRLSLSAPTTRGTWTLRVTNGGDVPVRIAADARVLSLDVTPRGARRPVHCDLPDDMRPEGGDVERPLVLPPGRAYAESFEARLYCFGPARGAALAPGSIVVAHLGWTGKRPSFFEVAPLDGVEPRITPQGALEAPPIVLPDEPTPRASPEGPSGAPSPATDLGAPKLSVSSGRWVDAASASAVEVPVSLRNEATSAVVLRYQPEVLRFDVVGRDGADRCTWPALLGAPTREQFTTLAPGKSTTMLVTLPTYCGAKTFDQSGVFYVRAQVDTRNSGGASLGLHAFEGQLFSSDATVVRLHKGRAPRPAAPPKLEAP
jgi:hypothetical protein